MKHPGSLLRGIDPVPLFYLALILAGVAYVVYAFFGRDGVIVLGALYGATWALSMVAEAGTNRNWW